MVSQFVIFIPLIIGMTMSLLVQNQVNKTCGVRPDFTPPPYVFYTVWPILYLIIGFVFYQFLKKHSLTSRFSIFMILAFLLLNMWYVIYGNICSPTNAFIAIILVTLLYYYITYQLYKMNTTYWYLMIALLVWMTFASFLTYKSIP